MRANDIYSEEKRQFNERNKDVLVNDKSPYKWWSTLRSAVFGSSSSLLPIVGGGGGLVCESVGKAHLLSDQFDRSSPGSAIHLVVLPSLPSSQRGQRLLLDFHLCGDTNPLGMFPLFLKKTDDIMVPVLV